MIKYINENTEKKAIEMAPWAIKIVKVDQGYLAFQTMTEYLNWKHEETWEIRHPSSILAKGEIS